MFNLFVFLCILASLSWCDADAVDYTFDISSVGNRINCGKNKDEDNPVGITIFEGQSLKLDATYKNIAYINKCQRIIKTSKIHTEDIVKPDEKTLLLKNKVEVQVKRDMGGTWNCTILTNRGTTDIQPMLEYYGTTPSVRQKQSFRFSYAHCYLQVHVRRAETDQKVLVNNMVLPTILSSDSSTIYDHEAIYYYSNGDTVNVSCIIDTALSVSKSLTFSYDYAEKYNFQELKDRNKYSLPKQFLNKPKTLGFAFRTTLGDEHDKSIMICKCYDKDDYTTVSVMFEQKQFVDEDRLAVNGQVARVYDSEKCNGMPVYTYIYQYYIANVQCYTNFNKYIAAEKFYCPVSCRNKPNFSCYKCDGKEYGFTNATVDLDFHLSESHRFTTNITSTNSLLEIYDYKDELYQDHFSWTYYAYDEDDNFGLRFFKTEDPPTLISCMLNGEEKPIKDFFKTRLTEEHDKSVLKCTLKDEKTEDIYFTSYIQFLMNVKTTTSTSSTTTTTITVKSPSNVNIVGTSSKSEKEEKEGQDFLGWAIPVVAVLMIIVVVIVILVIYRMRKKSQMRETDRNEILQSPSETSIPPYPPQWTATEEQNYHVPHDLRKETNDVYAVPVNAKETPYAVPIPKSKRNDKGENELIYAELNLSPKAGNSKNNDPTYSNNEPTYAELNAPLTKNRFNEEPAYAAVTDLYSHVGSKDKRENQGNTELYSQVLPKGARKNNKDEYGNVFPDSPYVNSSGAEYVEPTYMEAPRK